jgi:hypothetical protein
MRIEKRCLVPINRRVFVIELDMTGAKVRMVGILVEAEHQISVRFDPVYAVPSMDASLSSTSFPR